MFFCWNTASISTGGQTKWIIKADLSTLYTALPLWTTLVFSEHIVNIYIVTEYGPWNNICPVAGKWQIKIEPMYQVCSQFSETQLDHAGLLWLVLFAVS